VVADAVNVLFISDIVGRPGRRAVEELVPGLRERYGIDLCVGNAENVAHGFGLTPILAEKLLASGVDVLTSGNHLWDRKEILPALDESDTILRPANYPPAVPGRGMTVQDLPGAREVAVLCLQGRVFMHESDCPFRTATSLLEDLAGQTRMIVVDFHAEATSEKVAMGRFLDGRVSAVIGTHTHVQTADEQILPRGTAYLTDAGMTGPHDSVIGIHVDAAIGRFLTQVPRRFEVAEGDVRLEGAVISIDPGTGLAREIQRVRERVGED
jgi:metallophosphoesterase (TIGR00282 family)